MTIDPRRAAFRLALIGAIAIACTSVAHAADLRVAFTPGPYRDAFAAGIAPQLERAGYTIKYVEYSLGVQANDATQRGEVDANIFQHTVYLEANNRSQKFDLVPIVHVPTPPMGLYSKRHRSLADVPEGSTVTIPSDPVNAARALRILAAAGWVTIKPGVDPVTLSERDLGANPRHLKIIPLDGAQVPRSLADADFAAIQGNFAVANGMKLTDALKLEDMTLPYVNVVAVKRANQDARFARDIVAAYKSPEFQRAFDANPAWKGYRLPDYFSTPAGAAKGAAPAPRS
jgi:D-methionine transport system substrate-binding protein